MFQDEIPLNAKPYDVLAKKLHISPYQLWERTQKLIERGLIRWLSVSFDSCKLGFVGVLAAVSVQPELIEQAAKVIEQFPEVSHSYLRKDNFNIWFTIIAPDIRSSKVFLSKFGQNYRSEKPKFSTWP